MNYSFRRALWFPILYFFMGSALLIGGVALLSVGKWPGIIQVLLGIFLMVQALWLFAFPLIKIQNGMFYHKKGLFAQEDFEIKHLEKVNTRGIWKVELIFFNGYQEKIKLLYLAPSEKARFKKTITELVELQQSSIA